MENEKFRDILKATLNNLGYETSNSNNMVSVFKNNEKAMTFDIDTNKLFIGERNTFNSEKYKILGCIADLKTVIKAYENEESSLEKYKFDYYRKVFEFNNIVFAAALFNDNKFEYSTWRKGSELLGLLDGRTFQNYDMAKEDFAIRSGLVNENKMFSETDLKIIRQGLVHLGSNSTDLSAKQTKIVGQVIEKIEEIVPEILEHEILEEKELINDDELSL